MDDAGAEARGEALPARTTPIPGPGSVALVERLAGRESPGVTARRARRGEAGGTGRDPIVWGAARGGNVHDVDGNRYVDLTGGFGVALAGHAHPRVVEAVREQAGVLLHGMGDVYPNAPRIRLMERLAERVPEGLERCILGSSGSDAVEAALKTAALASGRSGVLAFWGSYHGLSYGALAATAYKGDFRRPFTGQLGGHVRHLPYGVAPDVVDELLGGAASAGESVGTLLVEPVLGRGGPQTPPTGWLRELRAIADRHGALLVVDEVFTGLGRTGRWWAVEHEGVTPDVLCTGKALGGGMPVSAAVARPEVMAAWGMSGGEALHTQTFLGHPPGAAAALAQLDALEALDAPARARAVEHRVRSRFGERVHGRGAMLGVEAGGPGRGPVVVGRLLREGFLALPGGPSGELVSLTPPLVLTDLQLDAALDALERALAASEEEEP